MSQIIDWYGSVIEDTFEENPDRASSLLKLGYRAHGVGRRLASFSDGLNKNSYRSRNYGLLASNKSILTGLTKPEESALINIFFPGELIQAFDLNPLFVEGLSGYLTGISAARGFIGSAEREEIPKSLCSYHKTSIGSFVSQVIDPLKLVANTTMVCDANQLTFKFLSEKWGVPHYQIDVPTGESDKKSLLYVKDQLIELAEDLESFTGKKLDIDRLREIIKRENRTSKLQRESLELMSKKYYPMRGGEQMNIIFMSHILKGSEEAEKYFQLFVDDLKKAPDKETSDAKRIYWVHLYPQGMSEVNRFFDDKDKFQLLYMDINLDMIDEIDERDPFLAMAQRIMKNPLRMGIDERNSFNLEMAKKLNADAVIYYNHWGCKLTLGGAKKAQDLFEKEGLPILVLDGDGADPDNRSSGQTLTRMEAFYEMVNKR